MNENPVIVMSAMLSASLALVRPVGMTKDEVDDWLSVAIETLSHLPLHIFEKGARDARVTCTHHSQIVPAILAHTRDALMWHNRMKTEPRLRLVAPETAAPPEREPLPDPETLSAELRRMGLSRGWIVEREGRLVWPESEDDVA